MPLVSHGTSWKFVSFQASRACSSDQSGGCILILLSLELQSQTWSWLNHGKHSAVTPFILHPGRLGQKGGVQSEEVPDPPSAAAAVGLMGFGGLAFFLPGFS